MTVPLLAMLRLAGASWETTDAAEVNSRHAQRNILLRNIASENLVMATHVVRTLATAEQLPVAPCRSAFAKALDASYRDRLYANRLYRNELYLSVLLRPQNGNPSPAGNVLKLFGRGEGGEG